MVTRIATFSQSSKVLQMAMASQAKLSNLQEQQASGLKATSYDGLGSDAGRIVDLSVTIFRSNARISMAELVASRSEMTSSALGDMSDLLTNMRASVSATSTDTEIASLQTSAEAALEDLASLINTQFEGRYLFAGSNTETSPADLTSYVATDLTTTNTDYYQGDDYVQAARISSEASIDYGVTGNNEGIEKAMRALSYLANASPLETADLEEAATLLVDAQNDILAAQTMSATATNRLESFIQSEENAVAELESLATDLTSVDIAAVAVEAKSYETQLEASYSALNVLTSLKLLDYLNL